MFRDNRGSRCESNCHQSSPLLKMEIVDSWRSGTSGSKLTIMTDRCKEHDDSKDVGENWILLLCELLQTITFKILAHFGHGFVYYK